ncbi:MAG: LamG domain-containing protein, partial [Planctomycetes bacterium]|nr:LamG domain-containing protein [Planctomycetota bacterium]
MNGEEVDASINSADGVVTVTAEPDGGLGIGSHTAKIVFTETTNPETERSLEWSFEVTAFSNKMRDFVDGEPNPIAYWDFDFADAPDLTFEHVFNLESVITNAKYTDDMGGHTGEAGDRAMDFLTTAANLLVPDGEFLNIASAFDKITVSLWQKNYATPNSSSFWGVSPSSNGSGRGIQAHIPWGNENIFFDTAGCCVGTTQRINLANAGFEWTEWHHYVFVKDGGHKSIWIDGTLFHEGDNSLALPSDFDFLYIGGNQVGGNSVSGIIDDFAVFASALTEEQIIALADGNTDILPEKREIEVPLPDIPILISKSPTGAAAAGGEAGISLKYRGIDFTDLSITVNDKAVDPTITHEGSFTTITADGAFSMGKNVIVLSWNGESETWNFVQFDPHKADSGLINGLIGYWPLDEIQGETTPDVISGYDMNMTNIDDSNVVDGKYGNAFSFANADQTLLWRKNEEGDDLPANQHDSFTVSFWSKVDGTGQNDLRLFSESNTQGNNTPLFNIGTKNNGSNGTIDIYIRGIGGGPIVGHIFSTAEPFDDEWHHVVFVQEDLAR